MPVMPVLKMGIPSLRERSSEVTEFGCESLYALVQDLKDSMEAYGGVGIAAPQIGVNKRVILFGFQANARYPNEKPVSQTVLINPILTPIFDQKVEGWEGCLSVPGLRGKVTRYLKIHYQGFDEKGEKIDCVAEGFHARIVQHECDHLDGILYPEKITDIRDFGFEDVLWESIYNVPLGI